jgi:hypothetical protein
MSNEAKPLDLDAMEARATRHLDGMTVNRDAMANDVLTLIKAVRKARQMLATEAAHQAGCQRASNPFDGIDDIFGKANAFGNKGKAP